MKFKISIANVQHIKSLNFEMDLSSAGLTCLVGKNGVGKTTLIRTLQNLISADTFSKTASPYIFYENSKITYCFEEDIYVYSYNKKINMIDTNSIIDDVYRENIYVELPIPHGIRFNHFQELIFIDETLRTKITSREYKQPDELISFLSNIYNTERFANLKEIEIKKRKYYFILKSDGYYIREDYLSSGEYFLIHLFKLIELERKIIAIDEIDISLDASAQVNLIRELKKLCNLKGINIIFTTHSLPLIKTLEKHELFYMDNIENNISIANLSYNHVKTLLFGFKGWDKYILTEDIVLKKYLQFLLKDCSVFAKYKIIYIGGGSQVVDLLHRNDTEEFLASPSNVICVLDGDREKLTSCQDAQGRVQFIPFPSIEKQLYQHHQNNELEHKIKLKGRDKLEKQLYDGLIENSLMTENQIFKFLNDKKNQEVKSFLSGVTSFLNS